MSPAGGPIPLAGSHDACFLPRQAHVTGGVQIHEMAWVPRPEAPEGTELWSVNTRFPCLCTRAMPYSSVPRWRPRFVSALAPEDRCHLNGLGVRDGQVRYATALGATDTPGGWRAREEGRRRPHRPRPRRTPGRGAFDAALAALVRREAVGAELGEGGLGTVDPATGRYEGAASLPGVTRGLDFVGPLAFVGLSQVRASAVFSGIAVAERPVAERCCGVWVVHIQSGRVVAYVKCEDAVQEAFAGRAPPRRRPDVLNDGAARLADSFVLPDEWLAEVAEPFRRLAREAVA